MVSKKRTNHRERATRPARTVENREGQMVSFAVDLAETQLRDGTASAQVISHYLKLGSTREQLEQERLRRENQLLQGKVEQLSSTKNVEELYKNALNAMRGYAGQEDDDEYDEYDDYDD